MSHRVAGRRVAPVLVVVLVLLLGLGGCTGLPFWSKTMSLDEVKAYMLKYLHDRYGQDFDGTTPDQEGGILGNPSVYHMSAHLVGDERWQAYFQMTWNSDYPDKAPEDGYLEVKMQPLFQKIAEDYLSSVFPENALYAEVRYNGDTSSLPGDISGEEYLAQAPAHVLIEIMGIMPMPDGWTDDDMKVASAPLKDGLPTLGVSAVGLRVDAYSADDYARYKNQLETQNIDIFSYGGGPLGSIGGFNYGWPH